MPSSNEKELQRPGQTPHKFKTQPHHTRQEQSGHVQQHQGKLPPSLHQLPSSRFHKSGNLIEEKTGFSIEEKTGFSISHQKLQSREGKNIPNKRQNTSTDQDKIQKEEPLLYYVPPKKSKPGVPLQEGSYVQISHQKEKASEAKKGHQKNTSKTGNQKQFKAEEPVRRILVQHIFIIQTKQPWPSISILFKQIFS